MGHDPVVMRGLIFVGLGLLLAGALPAAAQEGFADPAIESWIKSHAEKSKGAEHRNSRRAVVGDVDGEG